MSGTAARDRAPLLAGGLVALAMVAVVAFWALLALIGGNGFSGDGGLAWLTGNVGGALLAWIVAPWWAARKCAAWRRKGWSAGAAIVASAVLAVCGAALALFGIAVAMAGLAGGLGIGNSNALF